MRERIHKNNITLYSRHLRDYFGLFFIVFERVRAVLTC